VPAREIVAQAATNGEELADKAIVWAVMMMKQEALNMAFDGGIIVPG
jgi:hypothetical protein